MSLVDTIIGILLFPIRFIIYRLLPRKEAEQTDDLMADIVYDPLNVLDKKPRPK